MEELLGNYAGTRAVFERWMEWDPDDKAWMLFVRFEERCGEIERARTVFERYLTSRPSQTSFLKFSKFEERHRNIVRARAGFEKAVSYYNFIIFSDLHIKRYTSVSDQSYK